MCYVSDLDGESGATHMTNDEYIDTFRRKAVAAAVAVLSGEVINITTGPVFWVHVKVVVGSGILRPTDHC